MTKLLLASALTLMTATASLAAAPETPTVYGKLKAKVGSWAEYSVESKKGDAVKSKGTYRMSVVGKEGDALWIEQKMTIELPKPKKEGQGGVMKFLIGADGISKAYMKTPHGVMEMSGMMASAARKKHASVSGAKMVEAGTEEIEVPAGKFKATHYTVAHEKSTGDSWMKKGVGPYGLIKQVSVSSDRTTTLVLLDSGDDAKSEVDETTAQSMGDMMMGGRPKTDYSGAATGDAAPDAASGDAPAKPETPSLGSMFKSALKKKALGQ